MSNVSYKDAGVDIDAGNAFVEAIKPAVKSTFDSNVIGGIGSFAGAYALPGGYKEPVMLAATDGVGTKLKLAIESKKLDTVGIDLVAMCVNDLICNFGTPLFFLDYYATGKLKVEDAKAVVEGIAEGCRQSECALIGGETAEMPGMYSEEDFDLAGFSVGIAEKSEMNRLEHVKEGNVLIALPSSGIHSNGFSLVRKLLFEKLGMKFEDEFNGKPLINTLLTPTRIYVKTFKALKSKINALAHITGGGLVENLPRVLPDNMQAVIDTSKIKVLPIFELIGKHVEKEEMFRTFNMGVGMVLVVNSENVDNVLENSDGYVIGELKAGEKGVTLL
ncbi:phosphoribosylformylglycinamidine cyclo-ligase [Hydrogenimonas thermophila]|uniref:phosphoribosylformylglycinamidine cyclo-ligase n=1 Tax=Hydrogenimonas thermophila TaxID=223786 RepID=UPI002936DF7D|nr:phosphoribosylformylglycinamidine cyclo-ligase [Hydrogenimonas thermophila]WOE69893.1 phosphoribosylformylglycinamidine cyclo-ligase [Hydrogenimonas thermophila]WOE72408.1 phosphoribosylformylglycinamidine cyclo-ligase [Hydrogenimonas thermophila]